MSNIADPHAKQTNHARSSNQNALIDDDTCTIADSVANHTSKNSSSHLSKLSINGLPREILAIIFDLVLKLKPCPATPHAHFPPITEDTKLTFLSDPVTLSHVCLYWRHITIHTPQLWSHMDLYVSLGRAACARATIRWEVFIERAGRSLLDVHVLNSPLDADRPGLDGMQTDALFYQLIGIIAPRIKRLTIESTSGWEHVDSPRNVLTFLLSKCVPGTLKTLIVDILESYYRSGAASPRFTDKRELLDLPEDKLESLFNPITILCLRGYYPKAGSTAYQDLVELHLQGTISIAESALVGILKSNRRLRVLHLSSKITDSLPENTPITPVPLDDLRIVKIGRSNQRNGNPGTLLRWLHPGENPLSLTMFRPRVRSNSKNPDLFSKDETREFLARSKVTKLGLHLVDSYSQITELLEIAPDVQVLVIDGIRWGTGEDSLDNGSQHLLDSLYIVPSPLGFLPELQTVQCLIKMDRIRRLVLWSCMIQHFAKQDELMAEDVLDVFYTVCPVVDIMPKGEPSPVGNWY